MILSNDEKTSLVNQLDELFEKKPLFYLKFVKNNEYADDLLNGELYANTPEYFRKLEIETGERGQGDSRELMSVFEAHNIRFIDNGNSGLAFELPEAKITFQFMSDKYIPMVCFVGITVKDLLIISANENQAKFKLPFSDEQYDTMKDRFGDCCVIFDPATLIHSINEYSTENNIGYEFKKINYCHQQTKERMEAFAKSSVDRFYFKDQDLAYQNEYRLIFDCDIPLDNKIRLGKFNDKIKKINCDDIRNNILIIDYDLKFI